MDKHVEESECVERRDVINNKLQDKLSGVEKSHEVFRWLLSTFLILYFIILGFSLQRIITLENQVSKVEVRLELIEKFIKYNFNKIDKMEKQIKNK
jgi:thiosulfate reductase cytochrome b subunit